MNEAPWHAIRKSLEVRSSANRSRLDDLLPYLMQAQAEGCTSLRQIAEFLNSRGLVSTRGKKWTAMQVSRVLARLAADASRCDLRVGGFSIEVNGPHSSSSDPRLRVKAQMQASEAFVEAQGFLATAEVASFRKQLRLLLQGVRRSSELNCADAKFRLAIAIRAGAESRVKLVLSPHAGQSHSFEFDAGRSSLEALLDQLDRLLAEHVAAVIETSGDRSSVRLSPHGEEATRRL